MNPITISELRSNLSSYLDQVKTSDTPVVFGERKKKEFLIVPYPDLSNDIDLISYNETLKDINIQNDYYKGLKNSMSDWMGDEHDNLFK